MRQRLFTKKVGCSSARISIPCFGLILFAAAASSAVAASPLETLRAFCRLDGGGARVQPRTWPQVAPLVDWPLEPAWDRVLVISGYQLGTAREEEGLTSIPVTYSLVAEIRPGKVALSASLETYTYRLFFDRWTSSWRILGPASPPHLFETEVDTTAMAAALDPGNGRFVSNSAFAWSVLRDRGWQEPYSNTTALVEHPSMKPATDPQTGDLAVFFDHHTPYHVGVLDDDGAIVSATLNAGVQRTEAEAFAGEVRYFRPAPPETRPTSPRNEPSTATPTPPAALPGTESPPRPATPPATTSLKAATKSGGSAKRKKTPAKKKPVKKRVPTTKRTPTPH